MLKKIYFALFVFIAISVLNFALPMDEALNIPGMILYEFGIVDVSNELQNKIDLDKLAIITGSSGTNFLSLIPVTDSSGKLILALRSVFAELTHSVSEEYYHIEVAPEIVTTMGNPGSISVQKDKFYIPENAYTNEVILLSVLPERESSDNQFFSKISVYIAGRYAVNLATTIKHKENEWVPVALVRFSEGQSSSNTSGEAEKSQYRYTALFLRAKAFGFTETSREELFVWSDMSGLDKLFNTTENDRPYQNSFVGFLFGFNQSGLNDFSGNGAILVTKDLLLGAGLNFDTQNSSMSSATLIVGITGEDGLLLKLYGAYLFNETSERKLKLSLGFEDSTHPTEVLKLRAAWYPLTVYPFETGESVIELANYWSFEAGFVGKTGFMISSKIEGQPAPSKISAKIGYSTGNFEFSIGFSFELNF
ncbi:hypothetical protein AT15_04695 [Kosmotoga arenicorallina S304]|uniref:Uncharacterized protein n=1 Tax=Kosmotoga arenicorallina S304 TaxID=1453497 RepID=A0A176JXG7_9BACT|nr:hypothetical protein [Kosmotoga arenicorallina]OAA28377.1 hypothetical protein AT15_04695 [Kosmotoga arenicorallina S304]